jgi:hypothetical protein
MSASAIGSVCCLISGFLYFPPCDANIPNGINLLADLVEGAHVLPQVLVQVLHIVQLLDDWPADVEGEVGAIVVAPRMPAAVGVALGFLLAVLQGHAPYGVEVEEAFGGGRDDGARLQWFVRGGERVPCAREQQKRIQQRLHRCGNRRQRRRRKRSQARWCWLLETPRRPSSPSQHVCPEPRPHAPNHVVSQPYLTALPLAASGCAWYVRVMTDLFNPAQHLSSHTLAAGKAYKLGLSAV